MDGVDPSELVSLMDVMLVMEVVFVDDWYLAEVLTPSPRSIRLIL